VGRLPGGWVPLAKLTILVRGWYIFSMNSSFAALADARRIDILDVLRGGGRSVGEIRAVVGMEQGAVSKNLKALRDAGLVMVRKDGRRRIYQLEVEMFAHLAERLASYAENPVETASPESLDRYPMLRLVLNARLMRFFYLIREGSAGAEEVRDCSLLCRSIFSLIGCSDGVSWSDLVGFSGEEKGQVSRAVKVLIERGLVEREGLRAKITLTERGSDAFRRFMERAGVGDQRICAGLDVQQVDRLKNMTQVLTQRAVLLLEEEQQLSAGVSPDVVPESRSSVPAGIPRLEGVMGEFVTPPLLRLAAYLRRSATIAYRREAGLSNLAWVTLAQVGEHEQLTLTDLAGLIDRDKGQISRIVRDHKAAGLLKRQRGSKDGKTCLVLTSVGKDIYKRMCDRALRRDEFIFRGLSPDERHAYLTTLDVLIRNAEAAKAARGG
jgi:DNA-binding MarR family transcriptional regulator